LENGDLAQTKDGDIKVGDTLYSGLFRFVQMWRYNEPHLRYLIATMNEMCSWRERLDDKMNAIGAQRMFQFGFDTHGEPDTRASSCPPCRSTESRILPWRSG